MRDSIPTAPLQRMARYNLIIFALAVGTYLVAVPVLAWGLHQSLWFSAVPSLGVFGICGLWGFGNRYLVDRQHRKRIALDERELGIYQRAIMFGWVLFWEVFVVVCMGTWGYLRYVRGETSVPVDLLPGLVFLGMIVYMVTHSIAILVQYRRADGRTHEDA